MENRRDFSRLNNIGIIKEVNIKNNIHKWEVIDFSVEGLKIRCNYPQRFKKNENIELIVKFNSGKETIVKAIIKHIDINKSYYELGLEVRLDA